MAPTCKPGTTCLYHGSKMPDADTSNQSHTLPPGISVRPPEFDYRGRTFASVNNEEFLYDPSAPPRAKRYHRFVPQPPADYSDPPVLRACRILWTEGNVPAVEFVDSVAYKCGVPSANLFSAPNLNAVLDGLAKSKDFYKVSSINAVSQLVRDYFFVVAGVRGKDPKIKFDDGFLAVMVSHRLAFWTSSTRTSGYFESPYASVGDGYSSKLEIYASRGVVRLF